MARTVVVQSFGTFVGKRYGRLLIRQGPGRGPGLAKARDRAEVVEPPLRADPWGLAPAVPPDVPAASADSAVAPESSAGNSPAALGASIAGEPTKPSAEEIPLLQVGEIVLPARGVTVSTELLAEAAERGISVSFLGRSGKPYALLSSPMLTATVSTRREQLRALDDERGAEVCRRVVAGKLRNQAGLLVYFAKSLGDADAARRKQMLAATRALRRARREARRVTGTSADFVRPILMGIEGAAGRSYWSGVAALLEDRCEFVGRRQQGDVGPVNALLNYGYGILYSRVWAATLHAGLDPFAGFLHTDRPGKPSLVLDLVEELRAPIVDRAVLAYIGLGRRTGFDGKHLDEETRRAIADAVIERLEARVRYRGYTLRLSSVIQHQARSLVSFLRREGDWRAFTMYW
jgi:CRISPR-associated protein Cas1